MKKLVLFSSIFIAVVGGITYASTYTKKSQKTSKISNGITLNGVPEDKASELVSNFEQDNTSSDPLTNVWLSKKWIDNIYPLISGEGADGFRIYFAKRLDGTKHMRNTVVIVSTKTVGADPNAESLKDHLDYFNHSSTFLGTKDAHLQEDWMGNTGATLYYNPDLTDINCNPLPPNYLDPHEAQRAVVNFGNQKPNQGINTNSEWFPLNLLAYLQLELNAALTSKPSVPANGVRIYFVKNDSNASNKKHKYKHGFVFITTLAATDSTGVPINQDYYKCYYTGSIPKNLFGTNDNGEQCPNNCQGVTLPSK